MTDQVTSIEQSKRLIELGVPAEKASMAWIVTGRSTYNLKIWETDAETKAILHQKFPDGYIPAFTVADLLAVLPNVIQNPHNTFVLTVEGVVGGGWRVYYAPVLTEEGSGSDLVELLCNRIEWIVSNGYKLNI